MSHLLNSNSLTNAQEIYLQIQKLLKKAHFQLTQYEMQQLTLLDFGLNNFQAEGAAIIDILRSELLRITLLILLPNQRLPEHWHPAYDIIKGKEETIRVLYGQTKVFVSKKTDTIADAQQDEKFAYYTADKEIILESAEQFTIAPTYKHWFQAGIHGSVNLEFQNRVDETHNIFTDPRVTL